MKNAVMRVDLTTYKEMYDMAMTPILEGALIKLGGGDYRGSLFSMKEFMFEHSIENFNVYPDYVDLGARASVTEFIDGTIVNIADYIDDELEQLTPPSEFILDETYINIMQPLSNYMLNVFISVYVPMANHVLNCVRSLYSLISSGNLDNNVTHLRNLDLRVHNSVDYTIIIECMFFK